VGNFSFGDYFKKEIIPWSFGSSARSVGNPDEKLWEPIYTDDESL
jgi:alanyl-tRNA synthetase